MFKTLLIYKKEFLCLFVLFGLILHQMNIYGRFETVVLLINIASLDSVFTQQVLAEYPSYGTTLHLK